MGITTICNWGMTSGTMGSHGSLTQVFSSVTEKSPGQFCCMKRCDEGDSHVASNLFAAKLRH